MHTETRNRIRILAVVAVVVAVNQKRKVPVRIAYILGTGSDEFRDVGVLSKLLQLIREVSKERAERELEGVTWPFRIRHRV